MCENDAETISNTTFLYQISNTTFLYQIFIAKLISLTYGSFLSTYRFIVFTVLSNCRVSNCLFNCPSASNPNIGIIKGTCCQRVNVKMLITLILVQDTNVMKDAGCYNSLDNIRNAIHFNKLESLKSAFQYADCMLICVESIAPITPWKFFFISNSLFTVYISFGQVTNFWRKYFWKTFNILLLWEWNVDSDIQIDLQLTELVLVILCTTASSVNLFHVKCEVVQQLVS